MGLNIAPIPIIASIERIAPERIQTPKSYQGIHIAFETLRKEVPGISGYPYIKAYI